MFQEAVLKRQQFDQQINNPQPQILAFFRERRLINPHNKRRQKLLVQGFPISPCNLDQILRNFKPALPIILNLIIGDLNEHGRQLCFVEKFEDLVFGNRVHLLFYCVQAAFTDVSVLVC